MFSEDLVPAGSYIVKVTDNCNLYCPYCYHFKAKQRVPQSTLDFSLLESFIKQAAQYSPEKIWFIWHGGEPLLAGLGYYEQVVKVQQQISEERGTRFRNSIQTNATLVNHKWAKFLKDNKFGVGISLDGPKDLHDINRTYFSGKGSFDQTLRGIRILQEAEVNVGVLAVVTKLSLGREHEIFDFFLQTQLRSFDFLPCVEVASRGQDLMPTSITDEDYAAFMTKVFDIWVTHDDPSIKIRYFKNVMMGLMGASPQSCTFNGTCGKYVTLGNDGNILPCDNFVGYEELKYGSLNEYSLEQVLNSKVRKNFYEAASTQRPECITCEFQSICNGACRKYSYIFRQNLSDPNYFCGSRKTIFRHVADYLEKNLLGYKNPALDNLATPSSITVNA
jgi:uncharacterized protein